ncbi:TlpA family protein disulfide reductase [Parapedobacter sp. 10938]|uniref:TlpA family protein disulfide reductase n=1 Tax=Parapedobacter flavus TaxID=3110225 RepID=UPI002DBD9CFA|nr:hypothetical protein [Parapedobacter sp. 10938]MEC3879751.1 hypothetical protein [Parapedobacter sp. 10938]
MKIKLISLIVCCAYLLDAQAQGKADVRVTIGEHFPELSFVGMVSHNAAYFAHQNLDNKAIILDFGSTTCAPCVRSLPKIDSLQKEFNDELQFFFVTPESEEIVERFMENNPIGKQIHIPIISEDSILSNLFPHLSTPHEVWIDHDRVVSAFTDHHFLNKDNLQMLVDGSAISWPVKWDFPYDYEEPMVVFNKPNIGALMEPSRWQCTMITDHLLGVQPRQGLVKDSANNQIRHFAINKSIAQIYTYLLGRSWVYSLSPSRVIVKSGKNDRYFHTAQFGLKAVWEEKNTYCYDMSFPDTLSKGERTQRALQQLNWYFGIDIALKKQTMDCWVIRNIDRDNELTLGEKDRDSERGKKRGVTIPNLCYNLNQLAGHTPVVDETFANHLFKSFFKLEISTLAFNDVESLKNQLKPYGFTIDVEPRQLEVMIINDL